MAATEAQLPKRARRQLQEGASQQLLPTENYQDGLLVLEIVLQQLHDAPTLARLVAVSTDCSRLVQLHCKQHVCVCVSTELQRQQQRWELDPAGHDLQDADEKVVQSKPLEWLCSLAGRDTMSRPQVAHAVVGTLRFLDVAVVDAMKKPLALAGLQLDHQLVYDAAKSHTPHLERLARALCRHATSISMSNTGINGSSIFAGALLDLPGFISAHKTQLTMYNLPALLQIACTYSSASTVEKLVDTAIERLSDNMAQPGASKEHVGTTCHQLLQGCIVRYGAEKMAALARLPAAHSLGAAEVLGLLQEVLVMHPSQQDVDNQTAALIGCLTRLQGAKAISATDLHGTIVAVLAKTSITSDVPSLLLTLPGAAGFSVPEVMQLISAVAHDTQRINREEIDDESWQLLEDLDGLLSTRNVTRADVRQLLRELLPTKHAILSVLPLQTFSTQLNLLQKDDIETLARQAISRRSFIAARDMLTGAHAAAAQLAPSAITGLFTAVMKHQLDIDEWCDKDKTEEEGNNMQAVQEMLLALPPAAHFSTADADALLQSVLHKQLPTALKWLCLKCAAAETAWAEINPVQLKDYILSMLSDDDPSLTDSKQLADALQHPQLQQLTADQLIQIVDLSFAARVAASTVLKKQFAAKEGQPSKKPRSPGHAVVATFPHLAQLLQPAHAAPAPNAAAPAAAAAAAAEDTAPAEVLSKEAQEASEILATKVSTSRLSHLLQLPAMSGVSQGMLYAWVMTSIDLKGDCLGELLNAPQAQAAAHHLLKQQLQQKTGDVSLLERALKMPADSAFMQHLTPVFLHTLIEVCMEHNNCRETLQLLAKLPGAQQMTEEQVDSLMRQAQPPLLLWQDYQDVLLQLPNAGVCVVREIIPPTAAAVDELCDVALTMQMIAEHSEALDQALDDVLVDSQLDGPSPGGLVDYLYPMHGPSQGELNQHLYELQQKYPNAIAGSWHLNVNQGRQNLQQLLQQAEAVEGGGDDDQDAEEAEEEEPEEGWTGGYWHEAGADKGGSRRQNGDGGREYKRMTMMDCGRYTTAEW